MKFSHRDRKDHKQHRKPGRQQDRKAGRSGPSHRQDRAEAAPRTHAGPPHQPSHRQDRAEGAYRPQAEPRRPPRRDDRRDIRRDDRRDNRPAKAPPREAPYVPREGVLLWGLHAVRAAWLNPKRRCFRLWATEAGLAGLKATLEEAKAADLVKRPDPKKVERAEIDKLLPPGSVHQGVVLEASILHEPMLHDVIAGENPPDLVLLLDQVTDPHNVGAILRSAAALGAGAVILTERNAPGTTGVLAKAASGAIEHVPMLHVVNLARALDEVQQAGYWCVGLAEEGERDLGACDLSGRTALVLGAEGEGLRQLTRKKCNELARLPTGGPISSLNVSNAAAVALYEVRRQKGKFA